jgi:hypothetical protein
MGWGLESWLLLAVLPWLKMLLGQMVSSSLES